MVRVFVRHRVADYAAWREVYDSLDAGRTAAGTIGAAVYRSVDDASEVTVTHDFETVEAARALASSALLKDAMQRAGVVSEPEIWFTEPA